MEDPKLDKPCKSGGGWDTHGNNFGCLRDRLLPEFDRAFSALLDDLHGRGLLDETLVSVTSEMAAPQGAAPSARGGSRGPDATTGPTACQSASPGAGSRGA